MKRKISHGTSLLEIILAVGITSILTSLLVVLFSHSHSVYSGEEDRSEELRNLAKTMQVLSDRFTQGSVYLLGTQDKPTKGEGPSEITIEQFSELYNSDKISTFSFKDNQLVEKDYPSGIGFVVAKALKKPDRKIFLSNHIKRVSFKFQFPHTLEIALQGDHFSLRTEISSVKFSPEGVQ